MLNLEEPPLGYKKGCSVSVPLKNVVILLTRMPVKANYGREFYGPNSCPVGIGLRPPGYFMYHKQASDWLSKVAYIFL